MSAKTLAVAFKELRDWASDPRPRIGTGIPYLDNMMNGGLARSEYMMVTAFSGSGKTNLALNSILGNPSVPVMFYSIEMSARQVASRLAAMYTGHSTIQIEADYKGSDHPSYIQPVVDRLPLLTIDDTPGITIKQAKESFLRTAEALVQAGHEAPRLAIFDYLGLIGATGVTGAAEMVPKISVQLRNFARELDISVVALQQPKMDAAEGPLSLHSGKYGGHEPTDVFVGLYRPDRMKGLPPGERQRLKGQLTIQVLKNRPTGIEDHDGRAHRLDPKTMRITEWKELGGASYYPPPPATTLSLDDLDGRELVGA